MPGTFEQEIKLFYCYAREDKTFRDKLQTQLSSLNHRYRLTHWSDRKIVPGENWEQAINKNLDTADVILLLISPYFIASEYCYGKEMQRALELHRQGTCRIIPILLRPAQWEETPLKDIQLLPTNAKPITSWANRDDAYHDIVKGINYALENLLLSRKTPEEWPEEWKKEAHTFMKFKRYEEALAAWDQVLHLESDNAANYTNKGFVLSQLGRYEEAVAAYNQATDLDPNDDVAYISKGFVLSQLGRYEEAVAAYNQADPTDPHFVDFLEYKGEALNQLKRYEEALVAYDQAIRLDSESITAYEGKVNALINLNRDQEALVILEQIILLDPKNVRAYKRKGNLLEKLNRPEEALEAYDTIRGIEGKQAPSSQRRTRA